MFRYSATSVAQPPLVERHVQAVPAPAARVRGRLRITLRGLEMGPEVQPAARHGLVRGLSGPAPGTRFGPFRLPRPSAADTASLPPARAPRH